MADILHGIRTIGEDVASELGLELVEVQLTKEGHDWYLRFTLDKPNGISINDCELFSRRIEPSIDAEDPIQHPYILEVSSAGLDRPLLRENDYLRFTGRKVSIKLHQQLEGRGQYHGRLHGLKRAAGEVSIELEIEDGRQVTIPLAMVARAKLVPDYNFNPRR